MVKSVLCLPAAFVLLAGCAMTQHNPASSPSTGYVFVVRSATVRAAPHPDTRGSAKPCVIAATSQRLDAAQVAASFHLGAAQANAVVNATKAVFSDRGPIRLVLIGDGAPILCGGTTGPCGGGHGDPTALPGVAVFFPDNSIPDNNDGPGNPENTETGDGSPSEPSSGGVLGPGTSGPCHGGY